MAIQKPEWFKVDPAKFLSDAQVDAMSAAELGACFRLLCRQWLDGWIPDDLHLLSRLARLDATAMGEAWVTLCHFFPVLEPGKRANRFMWIERERVAADLEHRSDEGTRAARKRWAEYRKNKDANPIGSPMQDPMGDPMQDQSRAEVEEETTPLPPKGDQSKPSKPRGKSKRDPLEGWSPEVEQLVRDLYALWPNQDSDGRKINPDGPLLKQNLTAILAEYPGKITPEVILGAAREYLARDKSKIKAPQWFFSMRRDEEARCWLPYAREFWRKAHPSPQPEPERLIPAEAVQ